jgi:hypothetical protein
MVRMGATSLDIYYIYTTPYIIAHPKSYVKEQHPATQTRTANRVVANLILIIIYVRIILERKEKQKN